MKEIRILIGGMGNAARPMVDLLTSERERMENVYGLHFRIVGAVDSRGGVIAPNGISSVTLSEAKNRELWQISPAWVFRALRHWR